jgi:hypothetical protein
MHSNYSVFKDNRKATFKDVYSISILKHKMGFNARPIKKEVVKYKGKVYCVTVPTGNIIVRRNNKVVICGNCGKTAFYISLTAAPGGWLEQGAKVHIIGNEESTERLKARIASSITGLPEAELLEKYEESQPIVDKLTDNLFIVDGTGMTMSALEQYCSTHEIDILVIDQLDKLSVSGKYSTNEERLKATYIKARELAKKYNCGVIGICQAGFAAHNKMYYGFECLDGSKTGKAAECDWCITIGMEVNKRDKSDGYTRIANIPKNKLTGKKEPITFFLEPEISRIRA